MTTRTPTATGTRRRLSATDVFCLGAWLTFTGNYAGVDAGSRDVPILAATTITAVRAPANPCD